MTHILLHRESGHSTFIYRLNDQGLAVTSQHNQPFYPPTPPAQPTQQKALDLNQTGLTTGAIFTIQLSSIILLILFAQCYFSDLYIGFGDLKHYPTAFCETSDLFLEGYSSRTLILVASNTISCILPTTV